MSMPHTPMVLAMLRLVCGGPGLRAAGRRFVTVTRPARPRQLCERSESGFVGESVGNVVTCRAPLAPRADVPSPPAERAEHLSFPDTPRAPVRLPYHPLPTLFRRRLPVSLSARSP